MWTARLHSITIRYSPFQKTYQNIHKYSFETYVPFKMTDVCGQRPKHKHWFKCFLPHHDINDSLICKVNFTRKLTKDRLTCCLTETMSIFEIIINNQVVIAVSTILFLVNTNLLREKVQTVRIKDYFLEFDGYPHCLRDIQKFQRHPKL